MNAHIGVAINVFEGELTARKHPETDMRFLGNYGVKGDQPSKSN